MSAAVNNEDDDGVPLASYYLYDGINEVPSDVTHVRVAHQLLLSGAMCSVLRYIHFHPQIIQPVVLTFKESYYPKDCVASKNGRLVVVGL